MQMCILIETGHDDSQYIWMEGHMVTINNIEYELTNQAEYWEADDSQTQRIWFNGIEVELPADGDVSDIVYDINYQAAELKWSNRHTDSERSDWLETIDILAAAGAAILAKKKQEKK